MPRLEAAIRRLADRIANRLRPTPPTVDLEARLGYGPVRHALVDAAIADDRAAARLAAAIAPHLAARDGRVVVDLTDRTIAGIDAGELGRRLAAVPELEEA